jgi:flagellum-specific ATP synthase
VKTTIQEIGPQVFGVRCSDRLVPTPNTEHRTSNTNPPVDWEPYRRRIAAFNPIHASGHVTQVVGLVVESEGPAARLGDVCHIHHRRAPGFAPLPSPVLAEVVGFRQQRLLLMPLGPIGQIGQGSRVTNSQAPLTVPVGPELLGRVLDPMGRPIDRRGPLVTEKQYSVHRAPPDAMERPLIDQPLTLGVRAIDGLLTVGRGQRIGIFAGSGVGKSTLLGSIARGSDADVNVVALIGERGREVREFIERDLGPAGLARSVVVVATSDQPAVLRLKGALAATAMAEYFRDEGARVLLMMDSVTRFVWAQREIGLAIGEPPTTRGYTPSVLAVLPQLLERAGTSPQGSITGLYTVLVDGDDMNEPVADAARSILDGHIVLRRELAARGHYPAIDVLDSISRVMNEIITDPHRRAAQAVRELLATYRSAEDLIQLGAYVAGGSPDIDRAIDRYPLIRAFLIQPPDEPTAWGPMMEQLSAISD